MKADLEQALREELTTLASTTRTGADALQQILARAAPPARAPRRRWRPVLALAVVLLVAVAAVSLLRSGDDAQQVIVDLPPSPPVLTGTIVAHFDPAAPCGGACDTARFDLRAPGDLKPMPTGNWIRVDVLPDGRYVAGRASEGETLLDPSGASSVALGAGDVFSVSTRADGRLVMLARIEDRFVLRHVDPRSGATSDRSLPSGRALAVAEGPDRSIAVLFDKDKSGRHTPRPHLLVIDGTGKETVRRLPGALADRLERAPTRLNQSWMSWSSSGLLAISDLRPNANLRYGNARWAWTVVVTPDDGEAVAVIEGWQGTAWSPDGRGLLLARPNDRPGSDLAVFWGPGLRQRTDLGSTPSPVAPRDWLLP